MKKESRLLFATWLSGEELENLKDFVAEITEKIERHYGFTHRVEFIDILQMTSAMLPEHDRTYFVISSKMPAGYRERLEMTVFSYRLENGDGLTSFVADRIIGKRVRSLMDRYRSLVSFTSVENLKLQLYFEFCAYTYIGGLACVQTVNGGVLRVCGEKIEMADAAGSAVYLENAENMDAIMKAHEAGNVYLDLKGQYETRKGDAEYLRSFTEAGKERTIAMTRVGAREHCITDIMAMTSVLRREGAVSDDYRIGYTYFMRGDYGRAYTCLAKARSLGEHEWKFCSYGKYSAAIGYMRMRILPLLPKPFTVPGRKHPVSLDSERDSLLSIMMSDCSGKNMIFPLAFTGLTFLADRWNGRYGTTKWYRAEVKKVLDNLKKLPGDHRYDIYRVSMMLVNYCIDTDDLRGMKLYLDRSMAIVQELAKEYGPMYDMIVADTYITYSVYYKKKFMPEEMQDSLFCAADRYKSGLGHGQPDDEMYKRLGFTYRTLASNYAAQGARERAKGYLDRAAEWFEKQEELDETEALQSLAEMYEEYADIVKPEESGQDVSEAEECLLEALAAYKKLARIKPYDFIVLPGVMYDKLACLFRRAGEYDEGMDYFRSAEAEYKLDIAVFGERYNPLLAKCYVSMYTEPQAKDYDEAVERLAWAADEFTKAAEQDAAFYTPEAAEAWRTLAHAQQARGDTDDAIQSHMKSMALFDTCEEVTDNSVCYVSDVAMELAFIAALYDKDKEADPERAAKAEEFHLQAIGTAYCGDAIRLPDMGSTLQTVTTSYALSLLHPGFSAVLALLSRYITGTNGDDVQELADKAADYSDTRPDLTEEDDYVISQMLEAADRSYEKAQVNSDAYMYLLGAYHALAAQYDNMGRDKESKKYGRKAKKLFRDEFLPREDEEDGYDDSSVDENSIRETLGDELYEALMKIFGQDPAAGEGPGSFSRYVKDSPDDDSDPDTDPFEDDGYDYMQDDDDGDDLDYKIIEDLLRENHDGDIQETGAPEDSEADEQMQSVEKFIRSLKQDPNPENPDGNLS